MLVLQVCRNGSDDGFGRTAGVHLVALASGAYAYRGGLVIMTYDCEHRVLQARVGFSARDVADWRTSFH